MTTWARLRFESIKPDHVVDASVLRSYDSDDLALAIIGYRRATGHLVTHFDTVDGSRLSVIDPSAQSAYRVLR